MYVVSLLERGMMLRGARVGDMRLDGLSGVTPSSDWRNKSLSCCGLSFKVGFLAY